jgi:pyruvate formate lyase activating enzyme
MREEGPLITDIHHFALDDGPGIRTTVFLKGCPLSCAWCHNPETLNPGREITFHPQLCIGCGCCLAACPHGAILADEERVARALCTACGVCAEACPATALRVAGRYYSVFELTEILLKDRLLYETSEGGVTFSGGEPTLFMDFVAEAARELKENGIRVAVQTSGYFDYGEFSRKLLPWLDLMFFDLKIFDAEKHRKWTGVSNERILDNFIRLKQLHQIEIIPRIPLVPGITATHENVMRLGSFLKETGSTCCELLSYNSGGMMKRVFLGKTLPEMLRDARLDPREEENLRRAMTHVLSRKTDESPEARNRKEVFQTRNY